MGNRGIVISGGTINAGSLAVGDGAVAGHHEKQPREEPKSGSQRRAPSGEPAAREVFVSYAWNEASEKVVARLAEALDGHGIRLLRDRAEMRYRDSIREFMRRIGSARCAVAVISDKYLRSENCMFEMLELVNNGDIRDSVFPVVLPDADVYSAVGRVGYVRYWTDKTRELDGALKDVPGDHMTALQQDLNLYSDIRRMFDGIADTLRDMNSLTPDRHLDSDFHDLIQRIRQRIEGR